MVSWKESIMTKRSIYFGVDLYICKAAVGWTGRLRRQIGMDAQQ